LINRPAAR